MQIQPVKFTASGQIGHAAFTATITSPEPFNKPFQPAYLDSSSVTTPAQPQQILGLAYKGFTEVVIHNGTDATGDVAVYTNAPGTYSWGDVELNLNKGLYIECTGTGSGTVWLA